LFREYARSLNLDLGFQGFEDELRDLPGKYSEPGGCIILALAGSELAGCVALRPIENGICEMKRLFVREAYRGLGVGKTLVEKVIGEARKRGYAAIRLDTLPSMTNALGLYASMGFRRTDPYVYNPIEGAVFLEKNLADSGEGDP
jgi:ribosomal protein S18 acetylase RimI-like enzyme